ncbi:APC family permease [Novosphingobium lentum]|uniref:APC family permease n=1 Tax=Novosphingobium lentum TaxID=145287 RepID=UPI000833BBF6|nr:amino acid permease [Novosphingobium lentum]
MTDQTDTRPFGFWTATALVIGGMIGAGIFVLPSQLAPFGWTGVAAWIAGGVGAIAISLVLGGIARARPDEPGLMAIVGEVLGPVAGVLVGWGAWVSYWCANAYIALTAARYASSFWPPLGSTGLRQALAASVIIAGLTGLNLIGLRAAGRFQVVTTALKLLPMAAVVLIVAWMVLSGGGAFSATPHPPFAAPSMFTATVLAFVAIVGFESASIAAERVRDPARNVPRATVIGVALTCMIYLVVCTGIDFALPLADVTASNAPIALFVGRFWGPWAGLAIAGFAVVSAVGCLNVWVMMQGEVPLGLARAGLIPAWIGRTTARDIAAVPLVLASSLSIALLLVASWRNGGAVMDFMLRLTAVSGLWVYVFACVVALRVGTHRILASASLLFLAAMMYGAGAEPFVLSVVLMLTALPLYFLNRGASVGAAISTATTGPR